MSAVSTIVATSTEVAQAAAKQAAKQSAKQAAKQAADIAAAAAKEAAEKGTEVAKRAAADTAKAAADAAKKAADAADDAAKAAKAAADANPTNEALKTAAAEAATDADKLRRLADEAATSAKLADDLVGQTDTIAKLTDDLKNAENARATAKSPEELAEATKRVTELRKMMMQAVAIGGVIGTGIYLENKYNKADEDTKDCVKSCLPANWDGFEYGTLNKKELQYGTAPNTSDQPVCKESIDDCGQYCDRKCTDIHEYKMPGSKTAEGLAGSLGGAVGGVTGSFFEAFNPFAGMTGIFGEFTWIPFLFSILCVGIILVWGISKLR